MNDNYRLTFLSNEVLIIKKLITFANKFQHFMQVDFQYIHGILFIYGYISMVYQLCLRKNF